MPTKDFIKITIQDIEIAEVFFENDKHLSEFLINVIRYYRGKKVIIKSKIVKKYFETYKKTMDYINDAKLAGKLGAAIRAENELVKELALNDTLEGGLEETLPVKKKEERDKKEEVSIENSFELFWDHYHLITKRKKEDKEPALKYWKKLKYEEMRKAYGSTKPYYNSLEDKKFCKKARTYLCDKSFNDEFKREETLIEKQERKAWDVAHRP